MEDQLQNSLKSIQMANSYGQNKSFTDVWQFLLYFDLVLPYVELFSRRDP
jgi:hypothetical protein